MISNSGGQHIHGDISCNFLSHIIIKKKLPKKKSEKPKKPYTPPIHCSLFAVPSLSLFPSLSLPLFSFPSISFPFALLRLLHNDRSILQTPFSLSELRFPPSFSSPPRAQAARFLKLFSFFFVPVLSVSGVSWSWRMSGGGSRVSIPPSVRKTIENIKEITGNHSDDEIYAMLRECSMDPNETTQKLLLQGNFPLFPLFWLLLLSCSFGFLLVFTIWILVIQPSAVAYPFLTCGRSGSLFTPAFWGSSISASLSCYWEFELLFS